MKIKEYQRVALSLPSGVEFKFNMHGSFGFPLIRSFQYYHKAYNFMCVVMWRNLREGWPRWIPLQDNETFIERKEMYRN